ncbi:MAG: class I SAM-dependent methyltransferase [Bryobacteraceae bacterium]
MDGSYRDALALQHTAFTRSNREAVDDVQHKLWADLEKIRLEYERLIYTELRVLRQKGVSVSATPVVSRPDAVAFDYARFAERFRGSEDYVRERQKFYLPMFAQLTSVLDIGCGRGEFLELMRDAGVRARGIDLDEDSVQLCLRKGLDAGNADLFVYLAALPNATFDGIFSSQVVEHISPDRLPEMVRLCALKLREGGILVLETPNPECLAIFATHFYLDPTHTRPIPSGLLAFYMEESGLGRVEVHRLSPAAESMPSLAELPEAFRNAFFGGLDYGIVGHKL